MINKITLLWFVVILVGASLFRVLSLDLIEFKSDEAITIYQTALFYNNPYIIERGLISGIGVYNFPLFNYLMVFLSVFSRDPQFISFLIALINAILVVIFYMIIKKYYNQLTAIFASLLLAFSPWAVIFSRKIWAQDLILILLIPLVGLLHELIIKKNTKVTLWVFILLILLVQLHGSGLFFFVTTILIFVVYRTRLNLKKALIGILIGLVPIIPYIFFQINANPICPDCDAFTKYQNALRVFDLYNFIRPIQIMGGLGYHFVLGNDYNTFAETFPLAEKLKYIFFIELIIPILGTYYILTKKRSYIFIPMYIIIIPILYFVTRTNPYMHYFVTLIPFLALLYGISFNYLFHFSTNKIAQIITIIFFSIVIIADILFIFQFNSFLLIKKNIDGDYGQIYSETKKFVESNTLEYTKLNYYDQLKNYAYIYAQNKDFHNKIRDFFIYKAEYDLANKEFEKIKPEVK